ncbi:hypothetical protein BT96DRAFT_918676 [Gymnopus androsaceus JB14]|uniref:Uncharacterized protein n=1 Tax=Gymnopus androsaceus JB14 TaxID=1447944 RepID=A0A6A4HUW7_9AGAR|nr:hypothetical protein BT96DRAFT_918676 [Gymnopus androsaceus JB14]
MHRSPLSYAMQQSHTPPSRMATPRSSTTLPYDIRSRPPFRQSEADVSIDRHSDCGVIFKHPQMIRKPAGEVNRPGRGGYNLDQVANWTKEQSKEIKKYIKHVVETELDCTKSFTKQSRSSLLSIRQAALLVFPWLTNYVDLWVVDDLVRCRLRLQQAALKKKSNALLADEVRNRASRKAALEAVVAALE